MPANLTVGAVPRKPRISFFVHDLASNPVGRAIPIAAAMARDHEIEIIGFLFSGTEVYAPYRNIFLTKAVPCSLKVAAVLRAIPHLASLATGDVIVACKPLLTSFGPAWYAARRVGTRHLHLDVDDDEWIPLGASSLREFVWRDLIKGWKHATAWKYTRLLHFALSQADSRTVVSRALRKRYGGTMLRHGPDESIFNPESADLLDRVRLRNDLGLPHDKKLALFAGSPRPHKGLDTLLDAFLDPRCSGWSLVLVAPPDNPEVQAISAALGERCHALGYVQYPEGMAQVLASVDAVTIPQKSVLFAQSQVPAKLLDAMAMARPIVATRVGDIEDILGNNRGWLITPARPDELAEALETIGHNPREAAARGQSGRQWYRSNASSSAIHSLLEPLLGDPVRFTL